MRYQSPVDKLPGVEAKKSADWLEGTNSRCGEDIFGLMTWWLVLAPARLDMSLWTAIWRSLSEAVKMRWLVWRTCFYGTKAPGSNTRSGLSSKPFFLFYDLFDVLVLRNESPGFEYSLRLIEETFFSLLWLVWRTCFYGTKAPGSNTRSGLSRKPFFSFVTCLAYAELF